MSVGEFGLCCCQSTGTPFCSCTYFVNALIQLNGWIQPPFDPAATDGVATKLTVTNSDGLGNTLTGVIAVNPLNGTIATHSIVATGTGPWPSQPAIVNVSYSLNYVFGAAAADADGLLALVDLTTVACPFSPDPGAINSIRKRYDFIEQIAALRVPDFTSIPVPIQMSLTPVLFGWQGIIAGTEILDSAVPVGPAPTVITDNPWTPNTFETGDGLLGEGGFAGFNNCGPLAGAQPYWTQAKFLCRVKPPSNYPYCLQTDQFGSAECGDEIQIIPVPGNCTGGNATADGRIIIPRPDLVRDGLHGTMYTVSNLMLGPAYPIPPGPPGFNPEWINYSPNSMALNGCPCEKDI